MPPGQAVPAQSRKSSCSSKWRAAFFCLYGGGPDLIRHYHIYMYTLEEGPHREFCLQDKHLIDTFVNEARKVQVVLKGVRSGTKDGCLQDGRFRKFGNNNAKVFDLGSCVRHFSILLRGIGSHWGYFGHHWCHFGHR